MHPPHVPINNTLDRLRETMVRLQERLADAQRLRVRFTNARKANVWPDLRSVGRFHRSGDHTPTH